MFKVERTREQRWSKRTRDGEKRRWRQEWEGKLDWGQPRASFLSLSLPSPPPPYPLSLHPQVTQLSSEEEGMKRLRENYTESFSLTRQGKRGVANFKQLFRRRGRVGERRAGQEGDRQIQRERKGQEKPSGIWGHGRWREEHWEGSELEKKQNLHVDPRQRGYCGGRKALSLR